MAYKKKFGYGNGFGTAKEAQDYAYKHSRVGASYVNKGTGEVNKLNDFQRGENFERFKTIKNARIRCARKHGVKFGDGQSAYQRYTKKYGANNANPTIIVVPVKK